MPNRSLQSLERKNGGEMLELHRIIHKVANSVAASTYSPNCK